MTHPRTGRRATLCVSWNALSRSHQLPSSVASLHRLRSAGRHRWSHRRVARNACPVTTHACFVLGFAFCCRVLSRVSQVPILSASFWHYLHFLVQSARIFFACGGQKHSISFFLYTEGRAHLSHERPPVFDTRSVAHACRSNLAFVLTISGHWCALSPEPSPCTRTLCAHADCCMRVLVYRLPMPRTLSRRCALGLAVLAALALSSSPFCYHHHCCGRCRCPLNFLASHHRRSNRRRPYSSRFLASPFSPPLLLLTVAAIAGTVVASTITSLVHTRREFLRILPFSR